MRRIVAVLAAVAGLVSAAGSVFFCWYTLRLAYITAIGAVDPAHRTHGYYIGAVTFPVATIVFGWVAVRCFRWAAAYWTQ